MQSGPSLVLVGASHRTASVEIRARLATVMPTLTDVAQEAVVLSTCNRVEIYIDGGTASEARSLTEQRLANLLAGAFPQLRPCLYILEGRDAATHLMRVAAGLDSIALGESQILGQVNRAIADAAAKGTAGAFLFRLFTTAIRAGKRAHNETAIGKFPTSISHVAVTLVERRLGNLAGKKVLLVGAGKIAQLTAQVLHKRETPQLAFINRTAERAHLLASEFNGRAFTWAEIAEALAWADAVIAATASPEPVLRTRDLSRRLAAGSRSLSIVDLASPRNVEHDVAELPGVHYAGIDDLDMSLDENLEKRRAAVPHVEALVDQNVEAYMRWRHHRQMVPLITDLRSKVARLADEELERALGALGHLDPNHRHEIALAVHRIADKLLHEPTVRLKSPDAAAHGYDHAVRHLFALSEPEPVHGQVLR